MLLSEGNPGSLEQRLRFSSRPRGAALSPAALAALPRSLSLSPRLRVFVEMAKFGDLKAFLESSLNEIFRATRP